MNFSSLFKKKTQKKGLFQKAKQKIVRSDEKTLFGLKANPAVFLTSFLFVFFLVAITLWQGAAMEEIFTTLNKNISHSIGWFFILCINVVFVFCLWLMCSPYGGIRLGGPRAKPDFTYMGWFAMLFSAGMGIGLLFFGIAEPITHFQSTTLLGENLSASEQAQSAMVATFLHWGFHAWALYAVVGLALAFFSFNLKFPLTIRSIFYPLWGDKIHGWRGDIIDIISVIATIFGLAASLGLGAGQVNAGLGEILGVPQAVWIQLVIIAVITGCATLSLICGLDKGIRFLSEWNMRIAFTFLLIILFLGPTIFIMKGFLQNLGAYLQNFIQIGLWSGVYESLGESNSWHTGWTIFYWAWWIAWCPFVGIFIARVSRGRTIREFLTGVVFVPSILVFFWFSVFGGTALFYQLSGDPTLGVAVANDITTALYVFLQSFPAYMFIAVLATILIISFFVTSSDSGSFVVDTLTSGGRHDSPAFQKIFWASMQGLAAGILLLGGGLIAMQAVTISLGVLFGIIVLIMCYSLAKALKEYKK